MGVYAARAIRCVTGKLKGGLNSSCSLLQVLCSKWACGILCLWNHPAWLVLAETEKRKKPSPRSIKIGRESNIADFWQTSKVGKLHLCPGPWYYHKLKKNPFKIPWTYQLNSHTSSLSFVTLSSFSAHSPAVWASCQESPISLVSEDISVMLSG